MATVDYTFYTYGDVSSMWGMLNSVVMIMGSSPYQTMIRLMVTLGALLMTLYMMGLATHAHRGWRWLVTVALMSAVLFGPKSTVGIEDVTGANAPDVVANVPTALAFFFGVKSTVGHRLTEIAETGFQSVSGASVEVGSSAPTTFVLPGELTYLKHGMMFGARAVAATRSANFMSPTLRTDVVNYVKDCAIPAIGNLIPMDTLQSSSNLWQTIRTSNNAMFAAYWNPDTLSYVYDTCPRVWEVLDGRIGTGINEAAGRIGAALFPQATSPAAARAMVDSGVLAAYSKFGIADAAATANSIILQNTMINLLSDASGALASQNGSTSAVLQGWAKEQGTVQTNASLIAQGETVGAAMPIVKNVLDMIMIAAFPVIAMLLIATEGEMLKSMGVKYILAMIWTELWPFMYAAISFIGNNYSAKRVAAMSFIGDGGAGSYAMPLSAINADAIYSGAISDLGVVGWAMGLVPVISGALVFGMDKLVSAFAFNSMGAQAGGVAGQAAMGNASGGQVNFDKYDTAQLKTDPYMAARTGVLGSSYADVRTPGDTGSQRFEARVGSSPVRITDVMSQGETWQEQSRSAEALGRSNLMAASSSVRSAFDEMVSFARSSGNNKLLDTLLQAQHQDTRGLSGTQEQAVQDRFFKEMGITVTEANRRELTSALATTLSASAGAKVLGFGVEADMTKRLQSAGSNVSSADVRNALQRASDTSESYRVANMAQAVDSVSKAESFRSGSESSKELSSRVAGQIARGQDFMRRADESFRDSKEYSELVSKTKLLSKGMEYAFTAEWNSFVASKGVDPLNVSSNQAGGLIVDFLKERTRIARNDDGEFLSMNVFTDVADQAWKPATVLTSDQYGGGALKDRYSDDVARGGLVDESRLPAGSPDAAAVQAAGQGYKARATAAGNASGVSLRDVGPSQDLKPLADVPTPKAQEVREGGVSLREEAQGAVDGRKSEIQGQLERGLERAPKDYKSLPAVSKEWAPGSAPSGPSGADLIPGPTSEPRGPDLIPGPKK